MGFNPKILRFGMLWDSHFRKRPYILYLYLDEVIYRNTRFTWGLGRHHSKQFPWVLTVQPACSIMAQIAALVVVSRYYAKPRELHVDKIMFLFVG